MLDNMFIGGQSLTAGVVSGEQGVPTLTPTPYVEKETDDGYYPIVSNYQRIVQGI